LTQDKQELMDFILDHYENPRNAGSLNGDHEHTHSCDVKQNGGNPGCGDIITVCLKFNDGIIEDFKFEGEGCIVSQAGTSIISEIVIGKSKEEIMGMGPEVITEIIGEELALSRPKCSTLGIQTVKLAIKEFEKQEAKKEALG
tara:strand:- start:48020 stop:48448 length:429 start_codon:yes stop_codon:yes gene_type:complete